LRDDIDEEDEDEQDDEEEEDSESSYHRISPRRQDQSLLDLHHCDVIVLKTDNGWCFDQVCAAYLPCPSCLSCSHRIFLLLQYTPSSKKKKKKRRAEHAYLAATAILHPFFFYLSSVHHIYLLYQLGVGPGHLLTGVETRCV
jgi:hypothetical protein